jgi:hypothetical protein
MASGWLDLEKLSHKPFSHYYRGLITPKAAVLHIMEGGLWGSWDWLERHVQLSTTFGVGKNGDAWQGVSIFNGAYGNGITYIDGTWRSRSGRQMQPTWHGLVPPVNPNRYTLSIEHEGFTGQPLTDAMKQTTVAILVACAKLAGWSAYQPGVNLIRHADINPVDKDRCPGTTFDLPWFAAQANKHLQPTAPKPERLPAWSRRWYTTLNDANIREGPGTAYPIVGTAGPGQRLDVFDIEDEGEPVNGNGQWLRCRAGDDVPGGFVSATLADLVVRSFFRNSAIFATCGAPIVTTLAMLQQVKRSRSRKWCSAKILLVTVATYGAANRIRTIGYGWAAQRKPLFIPSDRYVAHRKPAVNLFLSSSDVVALHARHIHLGCRLTQR